MRSNGSSNTASRAFERPVIALMLAALAPGSATGGEAASGPIEEVPVTAHKVVENAEGVPASLQVVAGSFLDDTDQTRLFELQYDVPGLVVSSLGFFGAGFALRGVSDQGGGGLAVASHLNGVHLGRSNLAIARLFDMERI